MGKRSIIASTVALIFVLVVLQLSQNLAMVSGGDDPDFEGSHFQVIVPATMDPTAELSPVADASRESAAPDTNFGDAPLPSVTLFLRQPYHFQ